MLLHPGYLVLLVLIPPLARLFLKSHLGLSRRGMIVLVFSRGLAVALMVVALARPVTLIGEQAARRRVVVLVDGSLSIPKRELDRARLAAEEIHQVATRNKVKARTLLFGKRSFPLERPDEWDQVVSSREFKQAAEGTDLEAALADARANVEAGESARVVLLSDGNPTSGNVWQAISRMKRARIEVYPVGLPPVDDPGVSIATLEVPERAFVGDTLDVAVWIQASASGTVHLTIQREDRVIHAEPVTVSPGLTVVRARSQEQMAGMIRFQARIDPAQVRDTFGRDNEAFAVCQVQQVPRVLVVTRDPRPDQPFLAALRAQRLTHDTMLPAGFPTRMDALTGYSSVVFDNVEAREFPAGSLPLLERAVKDYGGGFVMTGGRSSFAAGGFVGTPVEKVLPVEMPTKSYTVSSSVVLLLDCSGSMSGYPLAQAKLSAKALMRMLKGRQVGLYMFSTWVAEVFPPTVIGEDFTEIDEKISQIGIGGGTMYQPAMREALKQLVATTMQNKYVIFLTDGMPFDSWGLLELVDQMKESGLKLSTIGIGPHVDPRLMKQMADRGGGRYHQPQNLSDLTEVFRQEVAHIVEGSPIVEEPFSVKIAHQHAMVKGFTEQSFPQLTGYVGTAAKDRAEVVLASRQADPVLAIWRYGLGVSVAYTTDTAGLWSKDWVRWPELPRFWSQVLKATFRGNDSDYTIRSQIREQMGEIAVDAVDREGSYLNFLSLFAQVSEPDGPTVRKVDLVQVGPGRYVARFPCTGQGFYRFQVFRKDKDKPLGTTGAAMSASPEFKVRPLNRSLLEHLAKETGGTMVQSRDDLSSLVAGIPAQTQQQVKDWWPLCALVAVLVFFLEVALRRLAVFQADGLGEVSQAASIIAIAETYLKTAKDLDAKGEHGKAQEYYLKAHSYFLKAKRDDEAKRMWEKYRLLEERRGAG
ncbi:MAG: VWA domain-containing protein [Candidatus Riflebacteria bacterium]|nr:VWA domain-containing protein [Candidatus Riflebacteria bacterium]